MSPTVMSNSPSYANIKVVASDLDGTLIIGGFYKKGEMTERTIKALQDIENKGMRIIIASGRPPRSMIRLMEQANLKAPMLVCCNGATVLDSQTKEIIQKYSIDADIIRELIKEVKAHFGPDDILIGGESGANFRCEEAYAQKRWEYIGNIYHRVDNLDELANENDTIEKLMLLHREWPADQLYDYLEQNVLTDPKWKDLIHYTFSSPNFVEVSAVGVCKATAIRGICEKIGIQREDVIAFGDMPNDCEMLEYAGIGVAMGNAHPKVKDLADLITCDNVNDGVAVILEEMMNQI